jgi:hypothetical protein
MKPTRFATILFLLAASAAINPARAADADGGLLAIKTLGELNGQALACSEMPAAARAKALMLAHAPKTPRYGNAFDEATQAAYLAQTRASGPCPDAIRLSDQLNRVALQLSATLPIAAPELK